MVLILPVLLGFRQGKGSIGTGLPQIRGTWGMVCLQSSRPEKKVPGSSHPGPTVWSPEHRLET